ncbi:MAG: hypothetical protein M3Y32_09620 [Pseudomonadota bacterium]|nr:hypothetical protein [Pseudomonadota bacterium]
MTTSTINDRSLNQTGAQSPTHMIKELFRATPLFLFFTALGAAASQPR